MTDEEKAEEYAKGKAHEHYHFLFEENNGSPVDFAKLCHLDGLIEGRKEKWHDLRENSKDLPKHSGEYWCKEEKIWEIVFQGETGEHCAKCKDCDKWIDRKGKPVGK